jgi:hypothetical protein
LGAGLVPALVAAVLAADAPPGPLPPAAAAPADASPRPAPVKRKVTARPAPAGPYTALAPAKPAAPRRSLLQMLIGAVVGDEERAAPNLRAQAIDDQNIRNLESQFLPQFQQLLYGELAFLRRVGHVEPKQFVEVAKAAGHGLRPKVREYARTQWAAMRQGRPDAAKTVDPRAQVQSLLMPLVEARLSPEQAKRYRQECEQRTAHRKHAVVLNLVAAVDERLVLTEQERIRLVQSLTAAYQPVWDHWSQMLMFNVQCMPEIPDASIVPLLNEKQQRVWRESPKQEARMFWGFQFAPNFLGGQAAEIQEIARIVTEAQDDK